MLGTKFEPSYQLIYLSFPTLIPILSFSQHYKWIKNLQTGTNTQNTRTDTFKYCIHFLIKSEATLKCWVLAFNRCIKRIKGKIFRDQTYFFNLATTLFLYFFLGQGESIPVLELQVEKVLIQYS